MARSSYTTETHDTSQKSARVPAQRPTFIVIHHAATESFDAVVTMENGSKQVSSTVVVKDKRVASMFDEAWRAWSLSSQEWDSKSLSSETCNSGGAAAGWPISEASYVTLAKVVAEWCRRYSIPCNRERIIGHREVYTRYGASYATACPGGISLDRVVTLAQGFLAGTAGEDSAPLIDYALLRRKKEETMYIKGTTNADVYKTFTDANGAERLRVCSKGETAYALAGGLVITGDDATLTMTAIELQYRKPVTPSVSASVEFSPAQLAEIASHIQAGMTPEQVAAAVKVGMESIVGSIGFQNRN